MRHLAFISLCIMVLAASTSAAQAAKDEVGTVVALRGRSTIERDRGSVEAKVKNGILLHDAITTGEASRVKLLFIDDTVLTLGEKSRMVIEEFIHSKENRGKSIFNLLDGKMRSVVGKTKFEVHTPTAVAAARGTVILFEVGIMNGKIYTKIVCREGIVDVRSNVPAISGTITLTAGMTVTIVEGEPLPLPNTAPAPEVEKLKKETSLTGSEITLPKPEISSINTSLLKTDKRKQDKSSAKAVAGAAGAASNADLLTAAGMMLSSDVLLMAAPIQQQPAVKQPNSVTININVR